MAVVVLLLPPFSLLIRLRGFDPIVAWRTGGGYQSFNPGQRWRINTAAWMGLAVWAVVIAVIVTRAVTMAERY